MWSRDPDSDGLSLERARARATDRVDHRLQLGLTASTLYALSVNPNAREVNPALNWGGRTSVVIGKLGSTAALTWAITKLQATHPRIAKVIGFGGGIGLSALAARNLQMVNR